MANQYLTRQEITYASLEVLENNCVVIPNMFRDLDQEFGKKGGKIGDTIFVRKPPRAINTQQTNYQTSQQMPVGSGTIISTQE
jgi:hypothetical protein